MSLYSLTDAAKCVHKEAAPMSSPSSVWISHDSTFSIETGYNVSTNSMIRFYCQTPELFQDIVGGIK
jgi:hypothetical protein